MIEGPKRRDSAGRWLKGQTGNKRGRLPREVEHAYLDATIEKVDIDEWIEIIEKAVEQAKKGDARSREWLGRYLLGDPIQVHEYLFAQKQEITLRVQFGNAPQLEEVVEAEVRELFCLQEGTEAPA